MSMKLYVGNLSFQTSSEDLQQLFSQAGTVESGGGGGVPAPGPPRPGGRVVEARDTGRSRGFGFVEMSSEEEGGAAIRQFDGHEVGGRALKVNEAKPREDRGGNGGGNRFGGGNRGDSGRSSRY
jgi:cold-inducible RNA-binding protein